MELIIDAARRPNLDGHQRIGPFSSACADLDLRVFFELVREDRKQPRRLLVREHDDVTLVVVEYFEQRSDVGKRIVREVVVSAQREPQRQPDVGLTREQREPQSLRLVAVEKSRDFLGFELQIDLQRFVEPRTRLFDEFLEHDAVRAFALARRLEVEIEAQDAPVAGVEVLDLADLFEAEHISAPKVRD